MASAHQAAIYWDASAVLSALFTDEHSALAIEWSRRGAVHFLSSLAWAEVHAVIERIRRERVVAESLVDVASEALSLGPWRRLHITPSWDLVSQLARKWPLRGADLWHLAAVRTLREQLPELGLLTFDQRLLLAARGEGMALPVP